MKTLVGLLLLFVLFAVQFYHLSGFSFPSIIDDAREALMKFSTGSTAPKPTPGSGGRKKPRPPQTKPSTSFLEVVGKVEKSILEAQASGNKGASLTTLTSNIKLALSKKSYLFARKTLGQALYKVLSASSTGKRSTTSTNPGAQYLQKLKNELGVTAFHKLIGFSDDKTLMFVIDDTGSMGGEISAVKDISIAIVNALKGKAGIDYILSVFNDPTVGPTLYFEDGTKFIDELKKLKPHGGGDYAELTFAGMQQALEKGPQEASPMFVFTDATAKNVSTYKDMVIESAKDFGININFLIRGSAAEFPPFVETARETCGMILRLTDATEIKKLTSIALLSLRKFACMIAGKGRGVSGKRSAANTHGISVDDSVDKMIVSISTQNSNPVVTLQDPKGKVQNKGKISLYNAVIYELYKPIPGKWTLTIATSAGTYDFLVRGTSTRIIDFDYFFIMVQRKGLIPISQPLSGQPADAIVTVTGVEGIQTNNLKLDVIESKSDKVLSTLTLSPRKKSKAHFLVSFTPPSTPFRFQLRGTTKAGNIFIRASRKTIKPLTALVRVYKAMNGLLALPRCKRMYVIMKIFNNGPTEIFDVTINDPLGYSTSRPKQTVKVYRKRARRFMMWFKASSSAKPGKAYPVAVKIKGRTTGVEAGQVLNMIVSN